MQTEMIKSQKVRNKNLIEDTILNGTMSVLKTRSNEETKITMYEYKYDDGYVFLFENNEPPDGFTYNAFILLELSNLQLDNFDA